MKPSGYHTRPEWMAVGIHLDDDRKGIVVPSTLRSMDIDTETEDVSSYASPVPHARINVRTIFTVTMDEYRMVHAPTFAEAMLELPDLREQMGDGAPRVDLTTAMHTLFHLAGEHVETKEQALALEKVADFLGY